MRDETTAQIVREVIGRRRSTRRFSDSPISNHLLEELVLAGIDAPSGSNAQNQRFLIIQDGAEIKKLGTQRFVWPYKANQTEIRKKYPSGIVGEATAIIVVFSDSTCTDRRGIGEYYIWEHLEIQNCSASIQNILLLATAHGLANCWVSFSQDMAHTRLTSGNRWQSLFPNHVVPAHYKPQGIILLGNPKKCDSKGFPKGESKHGATFWESTERRPITHYLCAPRIEKESNITYPELPKLQQLRLRLNAKVIRACSKVARRLDRINHGIEEPLLEQRDSTRNSGS